MFAREKVRLWVSGTFYVTWSPFCSESQEELRNQFSDLDRQLQAQDSHIRHGRIGTVISHSEL